MKAHSLLFSIVVASKKQAFVLHTPAKSVSSTGPPKEARLARMATPSLVMSHTVHICLMKHLVTGNFIWTDMRLCRFVRTVLSLFGLICVAPLNGIENIWSFRGLMRIQNSNVLWTGLPFI